MIKETSDVDLVEVLQSIWRRKWTAFTVVSIFTVSSVMFALWLPNQYQAEVVAAPASQSQGGGAMNGLASQLGGLGSLVGLDIGGVSVDNVTVGLEVLQSRMFLGRFIQDLDLLPKILAATSWDEHSDILHYDESIYNPATQKWVNQEISESERVWGAVNKLKKEVLEVQRDPQSGIIRVRVTFYSPKLAAAWTEQLIARLNRYMAEVETREAEDRMSYLRDQLDSVGLSSIQEVLYGLIEREIQASMLAQVSDEYVLKTIDPAVKPEKKHKPSRPLIVLVGFFLGTVFGLLSAFLKDLLSRRYSSSG